AAVGDEALAARRRQGGAGAGLDVDLSPHGGRAVLPTRGALPGARALLMALSRRTIALAAGALVLALVPPIAALTNQPFYVDLVRRMMIFAIAAASLDLILGYGGMVSFGHAAYLGIGAYAVGIPAFYGVENGWLQWGLAITAAALAAAVIGAISLRLSGVSFIMITLAFAQMLYYLGISLETYGGDNGMRLAGRSRFGGPIDLRDPAVFYYVVLAILVVLLALGRRLVDSRFGMVIRAAKSNEARARAIGLCPGSPQAHRLRHRRRRRRAGRRLARQPDRVPDAGLHALDAVGRDHVHGDPRRHGHPVRTGDRRGRAVAARGRALRADRALADHPRPHPYPCSAVREARPVRPRGRRRDARWLSLCCKSAASASASEACWRATASTSTWRRGRRTRSSAPTAPARPRSSASSRATSPPMRARSGSPTRTSRGSARRTARSGGWRARFK